MVGGYRSLFQREMGRRGRILGRIVSGFAVMNGRQRIGYVWMNLGNRINFMSSKT